VVDSVAPQLLAMREVIGTSWEPGDGPSATIGKWLDFVGGAYPDMAAYCRSVLHMEYFQWCGMSVGYCMAKAGIRPVFGDKDTDRFLWALAWLEWGQAVQTPTPGDVVVFDFGGGDQHVTLFDSDAGGGYWNCLGGNQSHMVRMTKFSKSSVKGIRRAQAATAAVAGTGAAPAAVAGGSRFVGGGMPLTDAGLASASKKLGVGVAELWALSFTETEAPYGGFYADKRPQILYERHIFHRLTGGRFDAAHPDISNPHPGGYGAGGAHQYDRLAAAMSLDEGAALQSASWGIGQVLGENYAAAGFGSPQDMVAKLFASEDAQLDAVANEIISDKAATALASHDWKTFARIYNGPNYAANNYDTTLRTWFEKFSAGAAPDLKVRTAQLYLLYLGYEPSDIDGVWGKRTKSAMNAFQAKAGLPLTETLDDATSAAIEASGRAATGAVLVAGGGA